MKNLLFLLLLTFASHLPAQQLQLLYDLRHSVDPQHNARNFPAVVFEYFHDGDSTGSFLFKMQTDLNGEQNNAGQLFLQVSKNLRFWKPKVYLSLNYSGGLGVAPPSYGYYISNAFGLGASFPFEWKGSWLNLGLSYRYLVFAKPSHDVQLNFYFGRGFLNYRIIAGGSLVAYTQNRDTGTELTEGQSGKKVAFFADPQIWWRVWKSVSVGCRVNMFYNVLREDGKVQVYPSFGFKNQF